MSGSVDFFASSLVDSSIPGAAEECLLSLARSCPGVTFCDRSGEHFVRVHGGDAPRIEPLPPSEEHAIACALEGASLLATGGLEQVPTDYIVELSGIANVFVPGDVATNDGNGPEVGPPEYECVAAPLSDLEEHLDQLLVAIPEEDPDFDPEQMAFLQRVRGYATLARRYSLVLVIRYI